MELVNNKYLLNGGIDPLELCREYGTPLYVYDAAVMERQYRRITAAFSYPKLRIHYACKALSNLTVMRLFKKWGAGLDCVSIQEVQLGLMAGFQPDDILYTPNFAGA
ncbi:MAG: diaminopimelate decarboxylase, partial [Saprospiraceae bacterium]|nr:diaminopimelate decarboxylase [Saprospiraceae bacterium]